MLTMKSSNELSGILAILTSLFFIWGFITSLNDILIPHLKAIFTLNYAQAMLIQFCFFTAYFVISVPGGYLVEAIGYQKGIIVGLSLASIGCLLFYPAANIPSYPLFLLAFFVLATGITILQVAANPYVAILGNPETASSRLTLTQAFNSLGTTVAPYLGALLILGTTVPIPDNLKALTVEQWVIYQQNQAASVREPYLLLAMILFIVAIVFALLKLPNVINPPGASTDDNSDLSSAWHSRPLILGAIGIFVYVGAEVSISSFLISFLSDQSIVGMTEQMAGKHVSWYWGGAMVGRFLGALVMQRIQAGLVLTIHALAAGCLVFIAIMGTGQIAMWAILMVGLFNSIMFPTIFSLALTGLGKHTGQGSGILCTAIVGGAIIPVTQGFAADQWGIQWAFSIPLFCYGYIAYYGFWGSKLKTATLKP